MIVCPMCGSAQSLRLPGGKRECSNCMNVYELPPKPKRRRRSKPVEPEPVQAEEPTDAEHSEEVE